jgi:hypothetical protein
MEDHISVTIRELRAMAKKHRIAAARSAEGVFGFFGKRECRIADAIDLAVDSISWEHTREPD